MDNIVILSLLFLTGLTGLALGGLLGLALSRRSVIPIYANSGGTGIPQQSNLL